MFIIDDIASGIIQSKAAKDASNMQAQAHRDAKALQEQQYNQQRADHQPWYQAGADAVGKMGGAEYQRNFSQADFQEDPGYAFRMQEGQKALERSAAAKGGLQSGGTLKALTRYSQGVAADEYQNAYNRFNADRDRTFARLSQLAGMGQNAAMDMAQGSRHYADQGSAHLVGEGDARAAGRMGSAQATANAIGGVAKSIGGIASLGMGGLPSGGSGGGSTLSQLSGPSFGISNSNPYGVGQWGSIQRSRFGLE